MKWEDKKSDLINPLLDEFSKMLSEKLDIFKPSEEVSTLSDELISAKDEVSDLTADNDSLKLKLEYIQGYCSDLESYLSDAQAIKEDIENEAYID
tara:strand:+ start:264 stop:548 length:285 start_codon:yes stop_codon:yes gene_type:complete